MGASDPNVLRVFFFSCIPVCSIAHAWRSENHLGKSVLFFHVSLGTSAYVVGLGGKSLDPWSPPPPQPMTNLLTLRNNVTNIQRSHLTESPKKNWKTIHIVLSESGFCCWLQFIHGYPQLCVAWGLQARHSWKRQASLFHRPGDYMYRVRESVASFGGTAETLFFALPVSLLLFTQPSLVVPGLHADTLCSSIPLFCCGSLLCAFSVTLPEADCICEESYAIYSVQRTLFPLLCAPL